MRSFKTHLNELSSKKVDDYRQKAYKDQPAGDDGSDKYRKRKKGREMAFNKVTGRARVNATEETQLDELSKKTLGSYVKKAKDDYAGHSSELAKNTATHKDPKRKKTINKFINRNRGIDRAVDRLTKEETQLDELSKKTLGSYVKKASQRVAKNQSEYDSTHSGELSRQGTFKDRLDHKKKLYKDTTKRTKGMDRALDRLTKEETQLDELSKKTLGSYAKKAGPEYGNRVGLAGKFPNASKKSKEDMFRKTKNRRVGFNRAMDRLTKEETQIGTQYGLSHTVTATLDDIMERRAPKMKHKEDPFKVARREQQKRDEGKTRYTKKGDKDNRYKVNKESTQLDELSKDTLKSYRDKSVKSSGEALKSNDPKKLRKVGNRILGAARAGQRINNPKG